MNYGSHDKGHRANGFTTDGGFCQYQVNHINTLVAIPDDMTELQLRAEGVFAAIDAEADRQAAVHAKA